MTRFTRPLRPKDVGALIDLSIESDAEGKTRSMAEQQLAGVAALYNILCSRSFAYLADEVGMGKTYQALALAAVVWNEKPDARVLFISPRQNLQDKWCTDYKRFFASNYRRAQGFGDDRVASVLFREPVHRPIPFSNLRTWAPSIGMREPIAAFLRHTSFTRPIYLQAKDLHDPDQLWLDVRAKLRGCGLFAKPRRPKLVPNRKEQFSRDLNIVFARALNAKLAAEAGDAPYFDLVIIDEAQCLRHPGNQTNQVLHTILHGQVRKWLFMSATPAHGGPSNIPTVINHYPGAGEVLAPELAQDLPAMQAQLQTFMVRRSRRYNARGTDEKLGKERYRNHDREAWGVRDKQMSVLGTLAMGLVQKGLVPVLEGKNNRFRVGFLSSFESLQSSLGGASLTAKAPSKDPDAETSGDWHHDKSSGTSETEAPDSGFIRKLSEDFEQRFDATLPHPKVDSVVEQVAPLAFGTDTLEGGHKFLIFTRRVSTVATLCERLTRHYLDSIDARTQRCWGAIFDWTAAAPSESAPSKGRKPSGKIEPKHNRWRDAMARGGALFRFRQTFRSSGGNTLFFEDGWLQRLCQAGGVEPEQAAAHLPEELWAESWTHASHSAGTGRQHQYRAARLRYLAVQTIRRAPEVFGLDSASAAPWRTAYESILHEHLERAQPAEAPHRAPELFGASSLWTQWDRRFASTKLALPASDFQVLAGPDATDELCRRQVARSLLAQTFRLTDTLVDLYFAEQTSRNASTDFATCWLDWLRGEDPSARRLRHECEQWLEHLRLIVDSCLDGAGKDWRLLARKDHWEPLFNPSAVLPVTGGSGAHKTATRQFRTPSFPRVIVCTDTLKEGVDLHLFCDRVLHYGVAWTSGDLEQRVGRVDRYFSQIERRLGVEGPPPGVQLHVGYPHIVASLERAQVERVIERQRQAERLMNSPLAGTHKDERDFVIGASTPRVRAAALEPYRPLDFPSHGHDLVAVPQADAQAIGDHYLRWYTALRTALRLRGWQIAPDDTRPVRSATLYCEDRQHELEWSFDTSLRRYVITLAHTPDSDSDSGPDSRLLGFGRGTRHRSARTRAQGFTRMLVPTPDEQAENESFEWLCSALAGEAPAPDLHDAAREWAPALASLGATKVLWSSAHEARATLTYSQRSHRVRLVALTGAVRLVGVVARLSELGSRPAWDGSPTTKAVTQWTRERNRDLPLGHLAVERGKLVFRIEVLHGLLPSTAREALLHTIGQRADLWEAELTGTDRW